MNNKEGLNPVFISTLAVLPLITLAQTLNEIVFLGLVASLAYAIAISFVSILEKMTDRNLRFFVFMIIACAVISIAQYIYSLFPNKLFSTAGEKIDYCLVTAGILALDTIYVNPKTELTHYFYRLLIQIPLFLGIYLLFGSVREIMAHGTLWNIDLGFSGLEFMRSTPGALVLLAVICAFCNSFYLAGKHKKLQYDMLVSKYKMKINIERNASRIEAVNASERQNFGADELIEKKKEEEEGPKGE